MLAILGHTTRDVVDGRPVRAGGVPLYAAGGEVLEMRYGDLDEAAGIYAISFARLGADLTELDEVPGGVLQAALEPYTGTPYQGGALIAPLFVPAVALDVINVPGWLLLAHVASGGRL